MSKDLDDYLRKFQSIFPSSEISTSGTSGSRKHAAEFSTTSSSSDATNPAKRIKTDVVLSSTNVFAKHEEKMELIRLKAHTTMLETRISVLEQELEENHTLSERERNGHELTKNNLESRVSALERELSFIIEREHQALERASNAEKLLFEERASSDSKFRKLTEERRIAELEKNEQYERLRTENQSLHATYMEERRRATEFRHDCSQLRSEVGVLKRHNLELTEELKVKSEQMMLLQDTNEGSRNDLQRYREDCAVAMAMRDELLSLKALKQENSVLKKQVERYKGTSENTLLLKEQNLALEERLARLQKIQDALSIENNELKAAIAKSAESSGQHVSYGDLDELSRHCVDLKNENAALYEELQRLNGELEEKTDLVQQYETELEHRVTDMEITLATKDELLQSQDTKCNDLESLLVEKDAIVQELEAAADDLRNKLKVALDENIEFQRRFSSSITAAACQTENGGVDSVAIDELKQILAEKEARVDYLESRFGLKFDYDRAATRILHMDDNPLAAARKDYADRLKAIESENHALRLHLEECDRLKQSFGAAEGDAGPDITTIVNLRLKVEELTGERKELLEKLRKVEDEKQKQIDRMKEVHQNLTKEYREMCTLLTGFQLKMKDGGLYVVQSIYEKERGDHFLIQRGDGNEINLLQNEYTPRWMDFVETYLMTDHSIPAFLAAVTLSLYEKDKDSSQLRVSYGVASTSSST